MHVSVPQSVLSCFGFHTRQERINFAQFEATVAGDLELLKELKNHGAKITKTFNHNSLLHVAIKYSYQIANHVELGQYLIENGLQVNCRNDKNKTPLYKACKRHHNNWIYLLLFYGANANIADKNGILPIAAYMGKRFRKKEDYEVFDILLKHTFDDFDEFSLNYSSLDEALKAPHDKFKEFFEFITNIKHTKTDLFKFYKTLTSQRADNCVILFDKFEYILEYLVTNFDILSILLEFQDSEWESLNSVKLLKYLVIDRNLALTLLDNYSSNEIPLCSGLVPAIYRSNYDFNILFETILTLLSYGFDNLKYGDLDAIYKYYGYCDAFEILLHMKLEKSDICRLLFRTPMMAVLSYDINFKLMMFHCRRFQNIVDCCDYFASSRILECVKKTRINESDYFGLFREADRSAEKVDIETLLQVPKLLELSRDAARVYLIKRLKIKSAAVLLSIVRRLNIGLQNQDILVYKQIIYNNM